MLSLDHVVQMVLKIKPPGGSSHDHRRVEEGIPGRGCGSCKGYLVKINLVCSSSRKKGGKAGTGSWGEECWETRSEAQPSVGHAGPCRPGKEFFFYS